MPQPFHAVLHALRVHPVKSMAGYAPDSAAVEPWGLAGDRRWTLIDTAGKVVTQRQQPRLALVGAEPGPDGGVRLSAPGLGALTVGVPETGDRVVAEIFGTEVDAVLARPGSGERDADGVHRRLSGYLGAEVRLVHLDDPARSRPVDPAFALPGETVGFADGFPLLVTTLASLDALNSLVSQGDHPEEGPLPMDRFRPNLVVAGTTPWEEDGWRRLAVGEVTFRVAKPCGRCVITTTDQRTAERGREPLRTLGRHRRLDGRLVFGQNLVPESTGTLRVGDAVTVLD
ncbi:MOSC domain-containing protein [Streptomyces sp. NPDC087658]|uniref:MOSC domain-containing protein n=1 Tax=Streptomyces sp. NPDC087658 TaxID=3365800 RepID=UPI0037F3AFED